MNCPEPSCGFAHAVVTKPTVAFRRSSWLERLFGWLFGRGHGPVIGDPTGFLVWCSKCGTVFTVLETGVVRSVPKNLEREVRRAIEEEKALEKTRVQDSKFQWLR